MAGADDSRYVFFVPCADDDLRDQSIEAGICAPRQGAQFVGVHLLFVEGLADLGQECLVVFGVHRCMIFLVRIGNHWGLQIGFAERYGGHSEPATEVYISLSSDVRGTRLVLASQIYDAAQFVIHIAGSIYRSRVHAYK